MARPKRTYVVCLSNEEHPASLEPRKIYAALSDPAAEAHGLIRVIDESGEDYLYARSRFAAIELPPRIARALRATM